MAKQPIRNVSAKLVIFFCAGQGELAQVPVRQDDAGGDQAEPGGVGAPGAHALPGVQEEGGRGQGVIYNHYWTFPPLKRAGIIFFEQTLSQEQD